MIDANGYARQYAPKHHRAGTDGMVYEHVLVAEEKLGRELKDKEVVHHMLENFMKHQIIWFADGARNIIFLIIQERYKKYLMKTG